MASVPDRPVRARTRAGRLAAFDAWLVAERDTFRAVPLRVADVGFGETPVTVVDLAQALTAAGLAASVLGVEREPARVDAARASAPGLRFECGGFTGLAALGPFVVVRAANVLRGYREEEAPAIHAALGAALADGGVVLEGSTDVEGHLAGFLVLRRVGEKLVRERLVFGTDFERGFAPKAFRDVLPRDFRRNLPADAPVARLLEAWTDAWQGVRGDAPSLPEVFRRSVEGLARQEPGVRFIAGEGGLALLEWHPAGGVPAQAPKAPPAASGRR